MDDEGLNQWLEYMRPEDLPFEAQAEYRAHLEYLTDRTPYPAGSIGAGCEPPNIPIERAEFMALRRTLVWAWDHMLIGNLPGEFSGDELEAAL